ncbi:MAG TPA: arginase family protein [Vicinamibacteria bacterium]|nr:arginase family protein [Vicinamibacteria bacterium]
MTRAIRFAVLAALALGALPPAAGADDRAPAVALIKMPYRGERNLADLSDTPDYLEQGGLAKQLEGAGWRVLPVSNVALSAEEQKAYGEWNRLGLANGQLARMVSAEVKAGRFPVGLLANCSALMGMLGGLQHAGPGAAPLRVGLVFIDAHGDFNTPETTLSGMLGGMPVAISAGLGLQRLRVKSGLDPALPDRNIVLAAARDLDPLEKELLAGSAVERLSVEDIKARSAAIDRQMERLSGLADLIYVHVDIDVLDPPEVRGHPLTVPNGPTSAELAAALTQMFRHPKAAAFGVASTPSGDRDADGRSRQAAYNLVLGALKGVQQRGVR